MHRYEDEYYSGDEQEYEEEEEEEEERPPPKEELEYLELRQKMKESIRRRAAISNGKGKLPSKDTFGSFFGPSRPVISSRVIQESKSVLENDLQRGRMSNSNQKGRPPVSTSGSGSKNVVLHEKRQKVVNVVRRKVETLKNTRDYSFLLSDDAADVPVLKKQPPLSRSGSFPNSDARSAQLSARPKQLSGINGSRAAQGPPREEKRPVSANGHSRPVPSGNQMNPSRPVSSGNQMQNSRPAPSGSKMNPSRPASSGSQMNPSRPPASSGRQMQNSRPTSLGSQMQNLRLASSGSQMPSRSVSGRPASANSRPALPSSQMQQRNMSSSSQRPSSLANRQAPPMRPPPASRMNAQSANRNGQPNSRLDSQRSAPAKVPMDHHRKPMNSIVNRAGPTRPAPTRPLSAKPSLERKPSISARPGSLQSAPQRQSLSRPMSSDPRQRVEQRKVPRDPVTSRMIPKQSVPTSKHQMMSKPAPPKRPPPRDIDDRDRRPKKKPAVMSEDELAFSMIRQMFKTHRFVGRDDDDINMEANYEDIMKEERRSARIAKEEDEKELRLIEEEEKREKMRKQKRR